MKRTKNNIILFILLIIFTLIFKYSSLIKESIISSMNLWLTKIVPSMLPIYIIIDLLINYGILDVLYKIFKNNYLSLILISLFSGTPSNIKYIIEYTKKGLISPNRANNLLLYSYSPSPLFILNISNSIKEGIIILSYIYISNIILYIFSNRIISKEREKYIPTKTLSFINTLTESINKSYKILLIILGIIIVYGIILSLLEQLNIDNKFILSLLELTNALKIIKSSNLGIKYMILASTFGGLSIHTQVKSILEDTSINYKYFLLGRIISIIPILIYIMFD